MQIVLNILGSLLVIAIINPILLVPAIILGLFFKFLRRYYSQPTRSLKRLEGISKLFLFLPILLRQKPEQSLDFGNLFYITYLYLFNCMYLDWILVCFIVRSALFTHVSSSLQGLPTLRAFQAQPYFLKQFHCQQDLHTACLLVVRYITVTKYFNIIYI
jgi:ATP-binding cassette subfamily C (CFTR/MRP) protein 4